MPEHEIEQAIIGNLHALGLAGGPGGIDNVRQIGDRDR